MVQNKKNLNNFLYKKNIGSLNFNYLQKLISENLGDLMSDSSSNKGELKKDIHSAIKIILKILSCVIIAAILYIIPKNDELITTLRWIVLYISLIHVVIYWDWGFAAIKDFKATTSKIDLHILNGILLFSLVIIVSNLIIALQILPNIFILITNPLYIIIGTTIFVLSVLFIYITRYIFLKKSWRGTSCVTSGKIVTKGPYKLVRHPIYYFTNWMYLGSVIVFCTWWTLIATALVIIYYFLLGWREEKNFEEAGRSDYLIHKKRVPLILIQWIYYGFKRRKIENKK